MDYDKKLKKVQDSLDAILEQVTKIENCEEKLQKIDVTLGDINGSISELRSSIKKREEWTGVNTELIALICNCDLDSAKQINRENNGDFFNFLLSRPDIKNKAEIYMQYQRTFDD